MFKKFSEKALKKTHSSTQVLLILAIVIVVNFLCGSLNWKLDLTQGKEYTLSETTAKKLRELDDVVNIKVFFSEKVPTNLLHVKQATKDMLQEFQSASKNKIRSQWIDPKDNEEQKTEAQSLGVPEIQFNVLEKDAFQVTTGFAGLAVMYEDKKESIPTIENTDNLEYDLIATIWKLTQKEPTVIGFTSGHNEKDTSYLDEYLQKQYDIQKVNTTDGKLIDDSIKTLIIAGPTSKFSEREQFVIDQFLMKGSGLVVLQDSTDVSNNLTTTPITTGLEDMLSAYGMKFGNNLIIDPLSHENVTFGGGLFQVVTGYPFWPKIVKAGMNQESPVSARLESLVLPWAQSVSLVDSNVAKENKAYILASTSPKSYTTQTPYNLNPQQTWEGTASKEVKSYGVVAYNAGKIESYFKSKDIPAPKEGAKESTKQESTDNGRVIAVGDSDCIRKETVQDYQDNFLFFANIIDAATQDESLMSIRTRGIKDRPLVALDDARKMSIKYGNIVSSIVLVCVLAVLQWQWKKREMKKVKELIQ